jgi:hypothetical protein
MRIFAEVDDKQRLLDLVRHYCHSYNGFGRNLEFVVKFLHEDINYFKKMLNHAKSLNRFADDGTESNLQALVDKLSPSELPIVANYLSSLAAYVTGQQFEPVYEAATELLRSLKLADKYRVPKGYYSEEEIFSCETV